MKPLKNYANAQAYTAAEKLPVGAYKVRILDAKEKETQSGKHYLEISYDIAEGEYKDFFKRNYLNQTSEDKTWKGTFRLWVPTDDGSDQDEKTMRRMKTIMTAIEESNTGYHWDWDEVKLKGKICGALFNEKEYEYNGRNGFFTNCYTLISVDSIATAKVPAPTYLNKPNTEALKTDDKGFMSIPDGLQEELPFN